MPDQSPLLKNLPVSSNHFHPFFVVLGRLHVVSGSDCVASLLFQLGLSWQHFLVFPPSHALPPFREDFSSSSAHTLLSGLCFLSLPFLLLLLYYFSRQLLPFLSFPSPSLCLFFLPLLCHQRGLMNLQPSVYRKVVGKKEEARVDMEQGEEEGEEGDVEEEGGADERGGKKASSLSLPGRPTWTVPFLCGGVAKSLVNDLQSFLKNGNCRGNGGL